MSTLRSSTFTAFVSSDPDIEILDGAGGRQSHALHLGMYESGPHLTLYLGTAALTKLHEAIGARLAGGQS